MVPKTEKQYTHVQARRQQNQYKKEHRRCTICKEGNKSFTVKTERHKHEELTMRHEENYTHRVGIIL